MDVFVAALYVEQKSTSAKVLLSTEQRVQVVLRFVRETSSETIADELDAGLAANAPSASSKDKRTLRTWIADVGVGESMGSSSAQRRPACRSTRRSLRIARYYLGPRICASSIQLPSGSAMNIKRATSPSWTGGIITGMSLFFTYSSAASRSSTIAVK